jgi:hypothetical protein
MAWSKYYSMPIEYNEILCRILPLSYIVDGNSIFYIYLGRYLPTKCCRIPQDIKYQKISQFYFKQWIRN